MSPSPGAAPGSPELAAKKPLDVPGGSTAPFALTRFHASLPDFAPGNLSSPQWLYHTLWNSGLEKLRAHISSLEAESGDRAPSQTFPEAGQGQWLWDPTIARVVGEGGHPSPGRFKFSDNPKIGMF